MQLKKHDVLFNSAELHEELVIIGYIYIKEGDMILIKEEKKSFQKRVQIDSLMKKFDKPFHTPFHSLVACGYFFKALKGYGKNNATITKYGFDISRKYRGLGHR